MSERSISEWRYLAEKEISCADSCEDISAALTQAASHLGFDNCSCMISIASSFKSRCFQFIGEHLERCARESFDNWPLFRKGVIQDHMNDEGMIVLEGDHFLDRNTGGRGQENRENFGVACVVFPRPPITGVVVLARESKSITEEEYKVLSCEFRYLVIQAIYKLSSLGEKTITHRKTPLSIRETQVLRCIVDGDTSKQTARSLSISVDTVNFHLRNIYNKLGACNNAQAAAYAAIHGLI